MELTYNIDDIDITAEKVVEHLSSNIVLFYGEMGTGKTTFIKALVKALGSNDSVSSPSYSLVNEYLSEDYNIFHFDLYRLKDLQEAVDFGFDEYLNNKDVVFIEWPEKILELLPDKVDVISLIRQKNNSRTLKLRQNINLTEENLMKQHHFY